MLIVEKNQSKWLYEEAKEKIKLSLAEKTILENLDKKWKWIARDNNDLYIFENKPYKRKICWEIDGYFENFRALNHLFQFIKFEDDEPINIEELLKNCEVEE